ncbi:hypothetical protein GF362_04035 [Candidatus Dojkabacteria bacterium]|nr:hypothetical protein [Candidatus Dojkabacteria bacterium]
MHIHFVCTGNTFRSRLAEAYLKSKKVDGLIVSSSGVEADQNNNGCITWYAQRIAKNSDLIPFITESWRQTTKELLEDVDLVIFMRKDHLKKCKSDLNFSPESYKVWEIPDLCDAELILDGDRFQNDVERIKATEKIFRAIKQKGDELLKDLDLVRP